MGRDGLEPVLVELGRDQVGEAHREAGDAADHTHGGGQTGRTRCDSGKGSGGYTSRRNRTTGCERRNERRSGTGFTNHSGDGADDTEDDRRDLECGLIRPNLALPGIVRVVDDRKVGAHGGVKAWEEGGVLDCELVIHDAITALRRLGGNPWRWWRGEYERDYTEFYRIGGAEITQTRQSARGVLNTNWIPYVAIGEHGSQLLLGSGRTMKKSDLRCLGNGQQLRDFVQWYWVSPGVLRFQSVAAPFSLSNEQATAFRQLCDAIVANFPRITHRPDDVEHLQSYNIAVTSAHGWSLARTHPPLLRHTMEGQTAGAQVIDSQWQLQRAAPVAEQDGTVTRPVFVCDPQLTHLVVLWNGSSPWRPNKRQYRRAATTQATRNGHTVRKAREDRWRESNIDIATALAKVKWSQLRQAPGLSARDANCGTKYGIANSTPAHAPTNAAIRDAIFSWKAPPSTHSWLQTLNQRNASTADLEGTLARIHYWLEIAWRQLTTCVLRRLWSQHVAERLTPSADHASADTATVLKHWRDAMMATLTHITHTAYSSHAADGDIQRMLCTGLTGSDPTVVCFDTAPHHQYILFFDGGSRGNPGPGGSGSVIVEVAANSTTSSIIWAASMAYSHRSTTNNQAEYRGLCTGLAKAVQHNWHPLQVVGDSMMIINQMTNHRPPRATTLFKAHEVAQAHAARLLVSKWQHHYREQNKMADKAANLAMDSQASFQTHRQDHRPELLLLDEWKDNDMAQWQAPHHRTTDRAT